MNIPYLKLSLIEKIRIDIHGSGGIIPTYLRLYLSKESK